MRAVMRESRLTLALFGLAVIGCSSPPAAPAPPVVPARTAAKEPATDAREALLAKVLGDVSDISDEVAALRELPFKHPVAAGRQSTAEFRRVLQREISRQLPPEKSRRSSKAYHHLGILRSPIDVASSIVDMAVGQVAAYYDPETGRFWVVSLSDDASWLETMTAHELVHGLQDQHFNLRRYYGEPSPEQPERVELSEDQLNARRFVVEGEASFVMMMHLATRSSGKTSSAIASAALMSRVRLMVGAMASTSWQAMVAQADHDLEQKRRTGSASSSSQALSDVAPLLLVPTLESYTRGAETVSQVLEDGGWAAVAELFSTPPDSTEQVLHPREKLVGKRDAPTAIVLPDLSGRLGKPLLEETMGELGWRVYLETWELPAADVAAAGWDGDRVVVYDSPAGPVGLLAFVWDSEDDAIEFENAFRRSLKARTSSVGVVTDGVARYRRDGKDSGGEVVVLRAGARLFVVDGANGARADSLLQLLRSDTLFTEVAARH